MFWMVDELGRETWILNRMVSAFERLPGTFEPQQSNSVTK
jgi:hypothetical protein